MNFKTAKYKKEILLNFLRHEVNCHVVFLVSAALDLECYDEAMGNGVFDGKEYADIAEGHGRFVRPYEIRELRDFPEDGIWEWEKEFECGGVKLKFYDGAVLKDGRQGSVRAWFKNSQGENIMGVQLLEPDEEKGSDAIYEEEQRWEGCEPNCGVFWKENEIRDHIKKFNHMPRPKIEMRHVKYGAGDLVIVKDGRQGMVHYFGRDPKYHMSE